jgi:hypothetical protein
LIGKLHLWSAAITVALECYHVGDDIKSVVSDTWSTDVIECCHVGDDIKSVVSDTWSTDVIASDSEPPEQNQLERLEEVVEEPAANLLGVQEVICFSVGPLMGVYYVTVEPALATVK